MALTTIVASSWKASTRRYLLDDLYHWWVKLDAYESDLAGLRYGQRVEFETEA